MMQEEERRKKRENEKSHETVFMLCICHFAQYHAI